MGCDIPCTQFRLYGAGVAVQLNLQWGCFMSFMFPMIALSERAAIPRLTVWGACEGAGSMAYIW